MIYYKQKYLKYKQKYLELKELEGGVHDTSPQGLIRINKKYSFNNTFFSTSNIVLKPNNHYRVQFSYKNESKEIRLRYNYKTTDSKLFFSDSNYEDYLIMPNDITYIIESN